MQHPFFATEEHLRSIMDECRSTEESLSDEMELLLQTHAWRQPQFLDGVDGTEENLPSEVECFRILARAIETGDLTEWNAQDPATFNSDWHSRQRLKQREMEQGLEFAQEQWRRWEAALGKLSAEQRQELEEALLKSHQNSPQPQLGICQASVEIDGEWIVVPGEFWQRMERHNDNE
jgi:hypothetical protein